MGTVTGDVVYWYSYTADVGTDVYWWTQQGMVIMVELCTMSMYTLVQVTQFNLPY